MTLTLQIENFHVLDDGGPVSINVPESGIQVGRRSGMNWVLPDASRYISGHHFDVGYEGGTWWLNDRSTNGTFLQGHRHRLDGPHALAHGDRFQVGQYIIVVLLDQADQRSALTPASLPDRSHAPGFAEDPWALDGGPAAPIDPLPARHLGQRRDFADDFIPTGPSYPPAPPAVLAPPRDR